MWSLLSLFVQRWSGHNFVVILIIEIKCVAINEFARKIYKNIGDVTNYQST